MVCVPLEGAKSPPSEHSTCFSRRLGNHTQTHMIRLPINDLKRHNISRADDLRSAVDRVLDSGWYVMGNALREFEAAFADYCGVQSCIGVGNGTDALEIALRALGVGPGAEVITAANAGMY